MEGGRRVEREKKKTQHGYIDPTYGKAVCMCTCNFKKRIIFAFIHFGVTQLHLLQVKPNFS